MKKSMTLIFFLMTAVSTFFFTGCKNPLNNNSKLNPNSNSLKINFDESYSLVYGHDGGFHNPTIDQAKSKQCLIKLSGDGEYIKVVYSQLDPVEVTEKSEEFSLTVDEIESLKKQISLSLESPIIESGERYSCDGPRHSLYLTSEDKKNTHLLSETICDSRKKHRSLLPQDIFDIIKNYCSH